MPTYSAGTALLDVIPSLAKLHSTIRKEVAGINPEIHVPVIADTKRMTRQIAAAASKAPTYEVRVEANKASIAKAEAAVTAAEKRIASSRVAAQDAAKRLEIAESQLAETRAKSGAKASQVQAAELKVAQAMRATASASNDAKTATAALADARKGLSDARAVVVKPDADMSGLDAKLRAFAARAGRAYQIKMGVDPDLTGAAAMLATFRATASRSLRVTGNVALDTGAATAKIAALSAATGVLGTVGAGALGVVGAGLLAVPGLAAAALGPIAALSVGLQGIGEAFGAFAAAEKQAAQNATSNAKAQRAAAQQIVSAREGLARAETSLSRARDDAAVGARQAARQVADAERDVLDAQRARLDAQQALTRAVRDAEAAQEDLRFAVAGGALAERQAVLDLAEAEKELAEARAKGVTGPELEQLQLSYERQKLDLDELRVRNGRLAEEKSAADKAGVQGSEQVVAAQQRVAEATRGVEDAQQGVRDAQEEAARQQIMAQRSISDAQLAVVDAQRQVTQALADSGSVGAASADKVAAAMAELSPNARSFVLAMRGLKPQWDEFANSVQDDLFAGLDQSVSQFAAVVLPRAAANVGGVATAVNGLTKDMLSFLSTGQTADQFDALFAGIAQTITAAGPALQTLTGLFLQLATAAQPGIQALLGALNEVGQSLTDALGPLIKSGTFDQALTSLAGVVGALGPVLGQVLTIAVELMAAVGPQLVGLVQALVPVLGAFGEVLLALAPVAIEIATVLAQALVPILNTLMPVITALTPILLQIVNVALAALLPLIEMAADLFVALMPAISAILGVIAQLIPVVAPLIQQLVAGLLPVITALTPAITMLAGLLAQALTIALQALVPVVLSLLDTLMPLIPVIVDIATQLLTALLPVLPMLSQLFTQLITALLPILPPLVEITQALLPLFIELINGVLPILTKLANVLTSVVTWAITNVVVPALRLLASVVRIVADVLSWLWRNIVQPVFNGIADIITWAWEDVIRPVFDFVVGAVDKVGKAFQAMSDTIKGVWAAIKKIVHGGIQAIVDIVYNNGIRALANEIIQYIPGVDYLPELKIPEFARGGVVPGFAPGRDVVPAMLSPGEAVLVPELVRILGVDAILAANKWAMRGRGRGMGGGGRRGPQRFAAGGVVGGATASPVGSAVVTIDPDALADLGEIAEATTKRLATLATLLTAVVAPAVRLVSTTVTDATRVTLPAWMAQITATQARQEQYRAATVAQWATMTNTVATSTTAQGQALGALRNALAQTRTAIEYTADWAVSQFARARAAAADPIRYVITGPLNKGLVAAWNRFDSDFALGKKITPLPVKFAVGGRVSGPGTGTSDSIPALLSNDEFVVRAAVTRRALPFLEALNSGQPEALQAAGVRRYARGGLVADTGSEYDAAIGRALAFARAQDGKPYIWGGVGPTGYDCSGFMSAITNTLRGEAPHRRLGVARSQPWRGFRPGLGSAFSTGFSTGHTAGTLAGVNVESGGSPSRTKFAVGAVGADSPQFSGHAHLPVAGGTFVPGGGAAVDFAALVGPYFADTFRMLGLVTSRFLGSMPAVAGAGVGTKATGSARDAAVKLLSSVSSTAAAGSPEVQAAVRSVATRFGWGQGSQWDALSWLIDHESSWNPLAANPTSSARGLFQKMTSIHGPVEPTPAGQAEWGLNYIRSRYGTPMGAKSHWMQNNWYDSGGLLSGTGWFFKGINQPERVLSPHQTYAFDNLVANIGRESIGESTGNGFDGPIEMIGEFRISDDGLTAFVRGEIREADASSAAALLRGTRI